MQDIKAFYRILMEKYGPQGWWPLIDVDGSNPTKTGSIQGYHPGDYSYPKTEDQRFEICIGAILTQNTSWQNVEKAIINLKRSNSLTLKSIKRLSEGKLRELIKVAGYYNQKARYLRNFIELYEGCHGNAPTREQLLEVKGIGPETADSILLYAYQVPTFVVDSYTRKIFGFSKEMSYDEIKKMFEYALEKDFRVFQEYHALIVEEGKNIK